MLTDECLAYYFFSDVFPPMHDGKRPLDPPNWWLRLFERRGAIQNNQEDVGAVGENNTDNNAAANREAAPAELPIG